ncbi:unnamed protein product [Rhizophagus irregularis]|nr:unnamed protein product [Rhizophagus irregularis]
MYLEDIRQIIKERQLKVYLSRFITDEQKEIAALYKNDEVETISPIPSILNETLTCSSSSTKSSPLTSPTLPTLPTFPISSTTSILPNTNINDVEISKQHPLEHNNYHLFRNVCLDEPQKKGKWSEDEDILFMKRLEEFGHHGPWGEFSLAIPGRNGYQCRDHFKALVKRGCIKTRKSDESTSSNTGHGYKTLTGPSFSVESFDFDKVLDEFISKLDYTYNNNYKIVSIGIAICGLISKEGIITLCEIEILQGWSPIEHLKNKFGQHVRFLTFNDAIAGL